MQSKVKLINNSQSWNPKKRYKINDVVIYLDINYQNKTGINSDPLLGIDWEIVKVPDELIEKTNNKTGAIIGYSETLYPNEKAAHDALDLKLNISDLPTNLTLYPTTTVSDVSGYVVMVKDIHDVRYNSTAVDVSTPTITTTDQLVSQRISDAGVLIGQPGVFNITTFGNIRHLSGSGSASFYFKVFHRDSSGVETLICTSSISNPVTDGGYSEFTASGVWDDGDFVATDRIVIKSYANRIAGGTNPVYQFQFGGTSPVRTLLPVPFSVVDAGYELKSNKQNDLTPDGTGTKYTTVDAVNAGLPVNYSKIVYVNATSPITATIFDTENPPVTNDNLLKNDVANLYIGTDASTWVYNSTTYVTKTVTATSSNFYLAGTTTDAGNTKTGHITRSGAVTLTGSLNMAIAKISTTPNTSVGSYDILTRNSSTTALEKKLVSDFLQTTGTQSSITGRKTFISDNTIVGGINIVNSRNITTPGTSDQSGFYISNSNTGSGLLVDNSSSGEGIVSSNTGTGSGININNFSTGTGVTLRNQGGTGDLLYAELGKVTISSVGKLSTTEAPTVGNNVTNKTYVDAKITQTITNGVTDKSPSEDAVYDAISNVTRNIVKDAVPSTSVTGTLTETILKSYLITANTFSSTDLMNIPIFAVNKIGTAGTATIRIYINTTNSLSGAVQLLRYNMGNTILRVGVDRHFRINGGNLMGVQFSSTTFLTDISTFTAAESSTPITISSDFYVITTVTLADATDSISQSTFLMTN